MPTEDYMSDDYIASLMTKDARESSIKYSALGLQSLLPKRSAKTPLGYSAKADDSHQADNERPETEHEVLAEYHP